MINVTNNEKLAEFLGILLGDGNLNKSSNCITIVGSLEEYSYYNDYIVPLIRELFPVNPKLRKRNDRNAIYVDFNSKEVMNYLENLGLVRGHKRNAAIPSFIKNSLSLTSHFLRGLFDTDGCLKFSRQSKNINYYPRIRFCFSNTSFSREIGALLNQMNFNFSTWKDNRFNGLLYYEISGTENLEKWISLIGINNPVQKTKHLVWKKHGYYIPKSSLNSRIKTLNLNINQ